MVADYGSAYFGPEAGNMYAVCGFEIENNSNREINISSYLSFDAYCDDYSVSQCFVSNYDKGLNGTIAPGKKLNGYICYEVPKEFKKLEILFSADYYNSNKIKFIVYN